LDAIESFCRQLIIATFSQQQCETKQDEAC
jgi:hypothetical protein